MQGTVKRLDDSVFNYTDYMPERFLHYYQQITHVRSFQPKRVLEIGPGDHTVTDFLRRKGIEVDTYDNDPKLEPTYLGDIRKELVTRGRYDLVLASEVFEHMNIKWLPQLLSNIRRVLAPGGILLVSLPYSTLRLFPPRRDYGRVISCEGRLHTHIPFYYLHTLLWPVRLLYRLAWNRRGLQDALCTWPGRRDVSFAVRDPSERGECVAIVPAHVTTRRVAGLVRWSSIESFGGPAYRPGLPERQKRAVVTAVASFLAALAKRHRAGEIEVAISALAPAVR